jgi:hypothetical protein
MDAFNFQQTPLSARLLSTHTCPASGPLLTTLPQHLTFGNQTVNTSSAPSVISLANSGTVATTIVSMSVRTPFSQTNNCVGKTLNVGGSCTIEAVFTPFATGQFKQTLTIVSKDSTSGMNLSGTGITSTGTVRTSATISSSLNPSFSGQLLTFTSVVTGSDGGVPTGTVNFTENGLVLGNGNLDMTGTASLMISTLPKGSHSIVAVYLGDPKYAGSSSTALTQTVNKITTSASLISSPDPSSLGQAVTFTCTVTASNGSPPTGQVTFKEGSTVLGQSTLGAAKGARISVSSLTAGTHTITAAYLGNPQFAGSSATVSQTVDKLAATASITSAIPNPSTYGLAVILSANISGSGATPTGTVKFYNGTTVLGTSALDASGNGGYTTTATALAGGSHAITGVYSGDNTYSGSTESVAKAASSSTVSSSSNPSTAGSPVAFKVTVTSGPGLTPNGSVTLKELKTVLGTATLSAGSTTITLSTLSSGTHLLTASYSGTQNYAASVSHTLSQTVK